MYYIALQMLFGDRAKYFAMVIGIAFAAQMMTQQPSIFFGLLTRTYSFVADVSEADIWVMDPGVKFVEESALMRNIELLKVKGVKGVKWAVPMYKALVKAKLSDGSLVTVDLTGLDNSTLVGAPYNIIEGDIGNLRMPDSIFVDINAAKTRLKVKKKDGSYRALQIGDILEVNDRQAIVIGIMKATRNFVLQPQIFTAYNNALQYASPLRGQISYILVKAENGANIEELISKIKDVTKLEAKTADQFKQHNLDYWMKNTGIPINFGITVLLGFFVGAAIAGQTFYGFVLENLRHYAVLKAMGVMNNKLIKIVLLQAFTVGFIGYGIGVGLTALFGMNFQDAVLAFRMPPILLVFAALGVLVIMSISALFGIRKVTSLDPADVFKG